MFVKDSSRMCACLGGVHTGRVCALDNNETQRNEKQRVQSLTTFNLTWLNLKQLCTRTVRISVVRARDTYTFLASDV